MHARIHGRCSATCKLLQGQPVQLLWACFTNKWHPLGCQLPKYPLLLRPRDPSWQWRLQWLQQLWMLQLVAL